MNDTELSTQSIFDIIEERKEKPVSFTWSTTATDLFYNPSDILTEGILLSSEEKGEANKYILTLHGLYKCKVNDCNKLVG
jgi:hypothetical protein